MERKSLTEINLDSLNRYFREIDGDILNISYDYLSEDKSHVALTIARHEKDVTRILNILHDKEARLMYNVLKGAKPFTEDVIYMLNKYYSLQDIAIISGKLRKIVLSKANSQLTVAYLENGTLLRSTTNTSG